MITVCTVNHINLVVFLIIAINAYVTSQHQQSTVEVDVPHKAGFHKASFKM